MDSPSTAIALESTAIAMFFYAHTVLNTSIAIQMDASRDA